MASYNGLTLGYSIYFDYATSGADGANYQNLTTTLKTGTFTVGAGAEVSYSFDFGYTFYGFPQHFSGTAAIDVSGSNVTVSFNGTAQPYDLRFVLTGLAQAGSVTAVTSTSDNHQTGITYVVDPSFTSDSVTAELGLLGFQPGTNFYDTVAITAGAFPNTAPTASNSSVSGLEDATYTFSASSFQFSDTQNNGLSGILVTSLPSSGVLSYNGAALTSAQVSGGFLIAAANIGLLTYRGAANANGAFSFGFRVKDDGGTANGGSDTSSNTAAMTVNLAAVNDAPTFSLGGNQTVNEDAGAQSVSSFASAISPGPANEAGQSVTFSTSNDNTGLFSVQPVIAADGTLTYTLAANAHGSATVSVGAHDSGGTANGGVDSSSPQTFTITVNPVDDAPTTSDATVTAREDTPYVFQTSDFPFADAQDSPANALAAVVITSLPASGTFTLDGVTVSAGQSILASDIAGGKLAFSAAADANGAAYASFGFQVQDDGGTANGGVDTSASSTLTISVGAVNDAPVTSPDVLAAHQPDEPAFVIAGSDLTSNDSPGPADEAGQTLAVTAVSSVVGGTAFVSGGQVTFAPTAGFAGFASFDYTVQDNGGTANGGLDSATGHASFTIADTVAPTLASTTPANGAMNAALGANIVLTFSENVEAGAGAIILTDNAGDTRTIDVTDATQVSFSGTTLTLNPSADLAATDMYHVSFGSGVVTDLAGNAFAGLGSGALDFGSTSVVTGGGGTDVLYGGAGPQTLYGLDGMDTLEGGAGDDVLVGGGGSDLLYGGANNDALFGGDGSDILVGDSGVDILHGDGGDDYLYMSSGGGFAYGGDGADVGVGSALADFFDGGAGNDAAFGYGGADYLYMGAGDDISYGGTGNDVLYGGDGDDYLDGGSGLDYGYGGAGADSFVLRASAGAPTVEVVQDFTAAEDSVILINTGFQSLSDVVSHGFQNGGYFIVQVNLDTALWLNNTTAGDLTVTNVLLVS